MFGRGGILITIAACALAVSAAAQAPAPTTTAFDGKYVGYGHGRTRQGYYNLLGHRLDEYDDYRRASGYPCNTVYRK
jgi:hypothetical protein